MISSGCCGQPPREHGASGAGPPIHRRSFLLALGGAVALLMSPFVRAAAAQEEENPREKCENECEKDVDECERKARKERRDCEKQAEKDRDDKLKNCNPQDAICQRHAWNEYWARRQTCIEEWHGKLSKCSRDYSECLTKCQRMFP